VIIICSCKNGKLGTIQYNLKAKQTSRDLPRSPWWFFCPPNNLSFDTQCLFSLRGIQGCILFRISPPGEGEIFQVISEGFPVVEVQKEENRKGKGRKKKMKEKRKKKG